jgi:hypothetical protein
LGTRNLGGQVQCTIGRGGNARAPRFLRPLPDGTPRGLRHAVAQGYAARVPLGLSSANCATAHVAPAHRIHVWSQCAGPEKRDPAQAQHTHMRCNCPDFATSAPPAGPALTSCCCEPKGGLQRPTRIGKPRRRLKAPRFVAFRTFPKGSSGVPCRQVRQSARGSLRHRNSSRVQPVDNSAQSASPRVPARTAACVSVLWAACRLAWPRSLPGRQGSPCCASEAQVGAPSCGQHRHC